MAELSRLWDGEKFVPDTSTRATQEDHGLELRFVRREDKRNIGYDADGKPMLETMSVRLVLQQRKRLKVFVPDSIDRHEWGPWEDVPVVENPDD